MATIRTNAGTIESARRIRVEPTGGITATNTQKALEAIDQGLIGGIIAVPHGGTGIASGTSGGVPYFSSTSAMASSALLTANGVVLGGGAGNPPTTTPPGTNGQILIGQTGAAPTWNAVSGDISLTATGVVAVNALHAGALASPSATIGLVAVNGSALTAMRSDAAPALSQAISPTWTGNHTFAPASGVAITVTGPSSLSRALDVTQTFAGTDTVTHQLNNFAITDSADLGANVGNGINIAYSYGGSTAKGSRQALQVGITLTAPTNAANTKHFYAAGQFNAQANTGDNGTNTGAGSKGSIIGLNPAVTLLSGATNLAEASGIQVTMFTLAGSSVSQRSGIEISDNSGAGGIQGATFDDAIVMGNVAGSPGWKIGLAFDATNFGAGPFAATGTAISFVGAQTVDTVLDASAASVTTAFLRGPSSNFIVTGAGAVAGGSAAGSILTLESTTGAGTTDAIIFKTASQTERARITTAGFFNVGPNVAPDAQFTLMNNTAATVAPPAGTIMHLVGADALNPTEVLIDAFGGQPIFGGRRAQGTLGAKTVVVAGNILMRFGGDGWNGSAYTTTAAFAQMNARETWSGTANGADITFNTTPLLTTTFAEAMRIQASGGLSIGTTTDGGIGSLLANTSIKSQSATAGIGYATGAGGTVTQATNRTTGVTLNTVTGAITLVSAAGSATPATFIVTNSAVAATDTVLVSQKSGTDKYEIFVTAVGAGSFSITSFTTGGTTTEQPVFSFAVVKGVTS